MSQMLRVARGVVKGHQELHKAIALASQRADFLIDQTADLLKPTVEAMSASPVVLADCSSVVVLNKDHHHDVAAQSGHCLYTVATPLRRPLTVTSLDTTQALHPGDALFYDSRVPQRFHRTDTPTMVLFFTFQAYIDEWEVLERRFFHHEDLMEE